MPRCALGLCVRPLNFAVFPAKIAFVGSGAPEQLRAECAELLEKVITGVPTVIFSAIDGKGADLSNVEIYVDDTLLLDGLRPDDTYLLCSDGLPKRVGDVEMLELVQRQPDLDQAVQALIQLANERGGKDNVTVILVRVVERIEKQLSAATG